MSDPQDSLSYASAGVDLSVAEDLTRRLKRVVESTRTGETRGEFGAFGGRFRVDEATDLVASADGVGTKVLVAAAAGIHHTVGEDLVNHCVNDILAEGAEPLFFLDYFACGRLQADVAEAVIGGVARGCRNNQCALIGGETAEMPGVYEPGIYDLAGFIVGRRIWTLPGKNAVRSGARLIGLPSNGLHTNGYSLARAVLFDKMGLALTDSFPDSEKSVAEVLLKVHRSYLDSLRPLLNQELVTAIAHITGGGIQGNLSRVLPGDVTAHVDTTAWTPDPEFDVLVRGSGLEPTELYSVLNMGVGLILVVESDRVRDVLDSVETGGLSPFECGEIRAGQGGVLLDGI